MRFETIDLRGKRNFPRDERGIIELVHVPRVSYAGKKWTETFAVRHRNDGIVNGWQVDKNGGLSNAPLWETGVRGTWESSEEAMDALMVHLEGRKAVAA